MKLIKSGITLITTLAILGLYGCGSESDDSSKAASNVEPAGKSSSMSEAATEMAGEATDMISVAVEEVSDAAKDMAEEVIDEKVGEAMIGAKEAVDEAAADITAKINQ